MPRVKRSVRRYKKKTLRKSNIFGHKSAKSQAKQIYALNKKINKIEKKTKPEITKSWGCILRRYFTSDGTVSGQLKDYDSGFKALFTDGLFKANVGNYELQGSLLRPQGIKLWGIFGFQDFLTNLDKNWQASESPYSMLGRQPYDAYLRLVIAYPKPGANQPNAEDMFKSTPGVTVPLQVGDVPDAGPIMGPLPKDITTRMTIIKNKIIKLTLDKPCKLWKYTIKYPKVYRTPAVHSNTWTPGEGELMIYYQFMYPKNMYLHFTTPSGITVNEHFGRCYFSLNYTMAFIDQN